MIKLIIDGIEEEIQGEVYENLDEVVGFIMEEKLPLNRMFCELKVNSELVIPENQDEMSSMKIEDVEIIELKTTPLKDILIDSLDNAVEYIKILSPGMKKCAEKYRVGEEIEAHEAFAQCMDGLKWFIEFTEKAKTLLGLDFNKIEHKGERLSTKQESFFNSIKELEQAQKNEDIVTIADILEYELSEALDEWADILPKFEPMIEKKFMKESSDN